MIHVFKKGGERVHPAHGAYSIECINEDKAADYLADGWRMSLDEAMQVEQVEQVEQESIADANGDGKLSIDEARAYLDGAGVTYEDGLHWKKVVALAEQHMKGEQ